LSTFKLTIDDITFDAELEPLLKLVTQPVDEFIEGSQPMFKDMLKGAVTFGLSRMGVSKPRGVDTFDFVKVLLTNFFAEYLKEHGLSLQGQAVFDEEKSEGGEHVSN